MSVGVKYDGEKPRWSLLPTGILWAAVAVMEHGAKKYSPNNWMHVPNGVERYTDAAARHLAALEEGENIDDDSGLSHVGHYLCSAIFAAWHMVMRPEALKAWRERGAVVVPVGPISQDAPPADGEPLEYDAPDAPVYDQHEHIFELTDQGTSPLRTWVCSCKDRIVHQMGSSLFTRHFAAVNESRQFRLYFDATRARPTT